MIVRNEDSAPGNVPFTDAARQLLDAARDESARLRHEYLGAEHVVLALTRPSYAPATLERLGVDPTEVQASISTIIKHGSATLEPGGARPYTSRTLKAITFAHEHARGLGHARVGVGDLLVGILQEGKGIGAQVLYQQGLTLAQAAEQAARLDGR
jgi:ATP-dependent Clp protease ATP-binding subunit ClpC